MQCCITIVKKRLRLICIPWEPLLQSWAKSEQFWVRNEKVEVMQQLAVHPGNLYLLFLFFWNIWWVLPIRYKCGKGWFCESCWRVFFSILARHAYFFIKLDQQPYVWLSLWEQDKKVFFINFLHIKSLVLFCIQSWNTIYIYLIQGKIFYIPVWLLQQWMMKHIFIRFHCVYVWLFKITHLGSSLSLSPLLWAIAPMCS